MKSLVTMLLGLALAGAVDGQPARHGATETAHYRLIHAGTLLGVPGRAPRRNMSVLVRGDRIERIVEGLATREDLGVSADAELEIVDLTDRFVLPGLMDAHVHLSGQPSRGGGRRQRGDRAEPTAAQLAVNAMIYARRTLAAGFTAVRDVGSNDQSVFAVRDAIDAGRMLGPRIFVAGSAVAVTGGHGDSTAMLNTGDPAARLIDGTCDGVAECRRAVRFQYKLGADLIKFTSTGGFGSNTGLDPQLFQDEIRAIVETAHLHGLKATTHAYSAVAIKDAVRAGVDSIEHGFLLDDEAIELMKDNGVWLVPTISASYPPPIFNIPDPPSVRLRNEYAAFERAHAAGVRIAFGTDAGTFEHGTNAKEFEFMVEYGMSAMDAIHAATLSTAELFGILDEAGSLETGKLADIIAVRGDPLDDIAVLHEIDFVMKSGRIAKRDGAMTEAFSYR